MAKDNDGTPKPKDPGKKLRKIIKNTRVAMLTTVASDGSLRSRPMVTPDADFDGELWFFTRYNSPKSEEVQENQKVNVTYASPKNDRYVSVSGTAALVRDRDKVRGPWTCRSPGPGPARSRSRTSTRCRCGRPATGSCSRTSPRGRRTRASRC